MMDLQVIDSTWSLFLDRDGVINIEKEGSYILNRDEFRFYENTVSALEILSQYFGRIIVVTNQRGVGKSLMTLEDLHDIHEFMRSEIHAGKARIDHIFYCTDTDNESENRKPNPGMAFQAKKLFPEIDLRKSVMIGNKLSDMQFGRNAGMKTVFVATTHPQTPYPNQYTDMRCDDLMDFAIAIQKQKLKNDRSVK